MLDIRKVVWCKFSAFLFLFAFVQMTSCKALLNHILLHFNGLCDVLDVVSVFPQAGFLEDRKQGNDSENIYSLPMILEHKPDNLRSYFFNSTSPC